MKNKLLLDELKGIKFMKGTDGSLIPLDAEGKQLNDANGNPVDFKGLTEGIIDRNFEFNITQQRSSPGNNNNQGAEGGGKKEYTGKAPVDSKEYMELLTSDMDSDQKLALKETYSEQFSK